MRTELVLAASIALCSLVVPSVPVADEPARLELRVGAKATIGGFGGMCDELNVATITAGANATITALRAGSTLCSSRVGGPEGGVRKVYKVVVTGMKP
jgi:hypothetical protein